VQVEVRCGDIFRLRELQLQPLDINYDGRRTAHECLLGGTNVGSAT
jgi:hypothetical protein